MEKLDKVFDIIEPQTLPEKVIPSDTDVSNTDFQYTRERTGCNGGPPTSSSGNRTSKSL